MHPIIAFLAFIFSPSDDWLLKQSFELFIDPQKLPAAVEQVHQMAKQYPSVVNISNEPKRSADTIAISLWADILDANDHSAQAAQWRDLLEKNSDLPTDLKDNLQLRRGEEAMKDGRFKEAEERFGTILASTKSPRALDARINLIISALAQDNLDTAKQHLQIILNEQGIDSSNKRALFAWGLTSYASGDYEKAADAFEGLQDDPIACYFRGLALRKLNKPHEALLAWSALQKSGVSSFWKDLTNFQLAETYFTVGDDQLCRATIEKIVATTDLSEFRLASLDFRSKNYDGALARLEKLSNGDLHQRSLDLTIESLAKAGRTNDVFKTLARKNDGSNPQSTYQTAWAALSEKDFNATIAIVETGLGKFYDSEFTPKLLLLQGLAHEHLGEEAEALAAYQTLADRFPKSKTISYAAHWTTLAYMRVNRPLEAITHGGYLWNNVPEEARRLNPDTAFWLAEAHLKLKRFEDAETHYRQYLAIAPPDHRYFPNAQFQFSFALAQQNRAADALASLDQFSLLAKELKKQDWIFLAQQQRGNIFFNNKNFAEAVIAYRSAGDSPKSMFYQAQALYRMDYFTDATATWTKLANAFPDDLYAEQASFRAARTQFELGAATQAVSMFASFIERYPESRFVKEARLQSAHALYNAGDVAGAAPLYAAYLANYPTTDDKATITPYLAACYLKMGKNALEAETLLKGLPPTEELASLRWTDGANFYNNKEWPKADHQFAYLLTETPSHDNAASAHFYLGESLFLGKQWSDADSTLASFLTLHKETSEHAPLALFHRGVALYNQDKLLKAAQVFETFVNEFPENALITDAKQNLALCYHSLGDWPTRDQMREKYQIPFPTSTPTAPPVVAETTDPKPNRGRVQEIPVGTAPTAASSVTVAKSTANSSVE